MVLKVDTPILIEITQEPEPKYKLSLLNTTEVDNIGALSSIPPHVLLMEDIRIFIHYKIVELEDAQIKEEYLKITMTIS